jgi:acetylornithine deacetylase/succinyl-diaminopimelate desuccinylase-like protein
MSGVSVQQLKQWFKDHDEEILKDFFTFLSFRGISTDPGCAQECRKTAVWLCDYLEKSGLEATLWETPGLPVVFASRCRAGKDLPTLLIYHHYDVQPVDPLDLWKSDPFKPEIREGQVYARGAVDNKGQCFYSLVAIRAFLELCPEADFNLKIFIEGEEETGGAGTAAILQQKEAELRADHLLVVDFGIPAADTPGITLGMRGIVTLEVVCSNSFADLHSGEHGGIALNPNRALATLLAGLWDKNGKVVVPHFYDALKPLTQEQLFGVDMTFDREQYTENFGVRAFCMEEGMTPRESNWLRPTLEINGMWGGYTGVGFKTVIPSRSFAKISCRLVPDQDPSAIGKAITEYLKASAPAGIDIRVDLLHGAPAFFSAFDSFIVKTSVLAYEEIFGKPCKYLFCGASVPIVVDLARASKAEVAMIGVGLAEDAIHAPNEHFGLDRLETGFLIMGRILGRSDQAASKSHDHLR